jgi:hypothetical protein
MARSGYLLLLVTLGLLYSIPWWPRPLISAFLWLWPALVVLGGMWATRSTRQGVGRWLLAGKRQEWEHHRERRGRAP